MGKGGRNLNLVPLTNAGPPVAYKDRDGEAGRDAMRNLFGAGRRALDDDGRRLEEEWLSRVITIAARFEREKC